MNLNEVLRIVHEEWDEYYRADLSCSPCLMKLIEFAFGKMDSETKQVKVVKVVTGHYAGFKGKVLKERGGEYFIDFGGTHGADVKIEDCEEIGFAFYPVGETEITKTGDSEPNTLTVISDEKGSSIIAIKKDTITVDFENNYPNNINT